MAFVCRALLLVAVAASCSDRTATGLSREAGPDFATGGRGPTTGGSGGSGGRGGQGGSSGAGGSVVAGGTGGEPALNEGSRPGPQPLYRLTDLEYSNTVRDLLGEVLDTEAPLLPGPDQTSFGSTMPRGGAIVSARDLLTVVENAELLATRAVTRLALLLPPSCASANVGVGDGGADAGASADAEQTCVRRFIEQFGTRAYRRPLEEQEQLDLLALYQRVRAPEIGASFQDAVRVLVSAFLQSPHFLYRWESTGFPRPAGSGMFAPQGTLVQLNGFEVASRLSYFLWASMPDQRLLEAAVAGTLLRPGRIAEEARRMLADQKARDGVAAFHRAWVGIDPQRLADKDPAFTRFTPEIARLMVQETGDFAASVLLGGQGDGKLTTLLTSSTWPLEPALAAFYGASTAADAGAGARPVTLERGQRAGLFTQGGFLATHADPRSDHPFQRGAAVSDHLLCQLIPPPPELLLPPLPEPSPGVTTRQRYEGAVGGNPVCLPCHRLFNGAGFAFSHYDAVGAFRTTENGAPIDAGGELPLNSGDTIRFKDAVELMQALAPRPEVQACVARHWVRWLLRREELQSEEPALRAALQLAGPGVDVRELLVALTRTRLFTHRALSDGEPLR